MAAKRVWKIVKVILVVVGFVFLYELIGILVSYACQPKLSSGTIKNVNVEKYYEHTEGNEERAAVIEKNTDGLLQRIRLIHNARESVVLSTFSFRSDESGKIVMGALLDAADRGVKIRLLVDGFESWTSMEGNPYFYALSSHEQVEIKLYNRANPFKPWKIMGRMHDKYLIADGKVYLLGGRNTYNYFLGDFSGRKNYDRDMIVFCENPGKDNSVCKLQKYFEAMWNSKECRFFHEKEKLQERRSVKKAAENLKACYTEYNEKNYRWIEDDDYRKDTFETENVSLLFNPIHTRAKESVVWYQLGELMKKAKERVVIHTPYIICNDMMYDTWSEIAACVPCFASMTNSAANNGNPFGSADYDKNREKILNTGVDIWEYEGGHSYHGKSILIDDDISVVGSFNMDMRSAYLDTEIMLVVKSKEVNKQLAANMKKYEMESRQIKSDGTYENPYQVKPVELTEKKRKNKTFIQKYLGWSRFLF